MSGNTPGAAGNGGEVVGSAAGLSGPGPLRGRAVVVGGGVIGTACAYYLATSGWDVTIVELGGFGQACSHGNCGLICPSHVLPLAEQGILWKTLRLMLRRNSPLALKLRFDPALWWWLASFARRCNQRDMLEAGAARAALLQSSRNLYGELLAAESLDCEWQSKGLLFVYRTPAAFEAYGELDQLLRTRFGIGAVRYEGGAVAALEPSLVSGLAGGWHYESDSHLRPDSLLASWRKTLERHGVTIREQCSWLGWDRAGARAVAAETSQGRLAGDVFVVATGALTPRWSRQLGCRLPIQPGKGYCLTMPRPSVCPSLPMIFAEQRVAVTPFQNAYRVGSTMEFAGYDTSVSPRRLELLRHAARLHLREPRCEPVLETWYGWRPMTYDDKPIIDRSPILENVYVAAGHGMLGVSMAPATGRLVAELINRRTPHVDPHPYRLDRF